MGDAGLFGDDARMELLDGEVIEMAPIGSPHGVNQLLITAPGPRARWPCETRSRWTIAQSRYPTSPFSSPR